MQDPHLILPLDIYYEHLITINGVEFTPREIDVISCILNRRAASIASFLLVGPRAVETYIRNIKQKAGLGSREQIIDFIERSDKFSLLKNEYYLSLRLRILFEEKLEEISRKIAANSSACLLVYEKGKEYPNHLIPYLKEHLKRVGCEVKAQLNEGETFFTYLNGTVNFEDTDHILYVVPKDLDVLKTSQINMGKPSNVIFLIPQQVPPKDIDRKLHHIAVFEEESYYLSFFEILKKFFPETNSDSIIEEFKQQYGCINQPLKNKNSQETLQEPSEPKKEIPPLPVKSHFLTTKMALFLIGLITVASVLSVLLLVFKEMPENQRQASALAEKSLAPSIGPNFTPPSESTLLNRSSLIEQIDGKFKKKEKGIQTLALIGIGGAGKTTFARHYADQQKADVIWEINAETSSTLLESFEKLAQQLARTAEDQKTLRGLREIKDSTERKGEIVHFVKERLKLQKSWFLLYDNVENFVDIQKYFPQDVHAWGKGKVLLTTRNSNIQNSSWVSDIAMIEGLNQNQKLTLFFQVMDHRDSKQFTTIQQEEALEFLKQIPPFPLDVFVAAHYLKATNTSYNRYLEYLNTQTKKFSIAQENLLKEEEEYAKTRYSIITLSLEKLIATDKNFVELLFFLSLLDSQDIPRDLLDLYMDKLSIDNFIYNVKKYSLITSSPSHPSASVAYIALHRSTQSIISTYLQETLTLKKKQELIKKFLVLLESYIDQLIQKREIATLKALFIHCETCLNHRYLDNETKLFLKSKMGIIYYYLGDYIKSKSILTQSLEILDNEPHKDYFRIAQILLPLGLSHWALCETEQAKISLERCVAIYEKYFSKNKQEVAQALSALGSVYGSLGYSKKAIPLLTQALDLYNTYSPENRYEIGLSLARLGDIYRKLGYYKQAKLLAEKSVFIYKTYLPENPLGLASSLTYLGAIYRETNEFTQAKAVTEEALRIYKTHFSETHPTVMWVLAELGKIYESLGDYDKAMKLFEQYLQFYKNHFPEDHILIGNMYLRLGNIYKDLNNYEKADDFLQKTIIIYKKWFPEPHLKFAWPLSRIGSIYKELGDYQKAKKYLNSSLKIYKLHYGDSYTETARVLKDLGQVHLLEGSTSLAESFFREALEVFQKNSHPSSYTCLENLSDLYLDKFQKSKDKNVPQSQILLTHAITHLKQALEIIKTHFPADSPHIGRIELKIKNLEHSGVTQ